nr:SBP-like protein [Tanacetum cinerariifolium]
MTCHGNQTSEYSESTRSTIPLLLQDDNHNSRGTSTDGFQIVQRKVVRDSLVSKHGTGGRYEKPMDDLVDNKRKKVRALSSKTGIWLSRKGESPSESGFMSPNPFDFLTKEDEKSSLHDLQESDDDADVENGYDETATYVASKSMGRVVLSLACRRLSVTKIEMETNASSNQKLKMKDFISDHHGEGLSGCGGGGGYLDVNVKKKKGVHGSITGSSGNTRNPSKVLSAM